MNCPPGAKYAVCKGGFLRIDSSAGTNPNVSATPAELQTGEMQAPCPASRRHSRAQAQRSRCNLRNPACEPRPCRAYRAHRRRGRVAEGGGLLNRYRVVKPYRGFESLRLRQFLRRLPSRIPIEIKAPIAFAAIAPIFSIRPHRNPLPVVPTSGVEMRGEIRDCPSSITVAKYSCSTRRPRRRQSRHRKIRNQAHARRRTSVAARCAVSLLLPHIKTGQPNAAPVRDPHALRSPGNARAIHRQRGAPSRASSRRHC